MILTCPECATSYTIPDGAIGAEGRSVKCRKCAHVWFAKEPEPAKTDEADQAPSEPGQIANNLESNDDGDEPAAESKEIDIESSPNPDSIRPEEAENSQKEIVVGYETAAQEVNRGNLPKKTRGRQPVPAHLVRVAGVAAILVFIAGAAFLFRESVVRAMPASAKLFAAIGYPVNLRGLEFQNITFERGFEDGLPVLAIFGEVVNITEKRIDLPKIRFALRDSSEQEIYYWSGAIGQETLAPGQTVTFTTRLASPPMTAQNIMVRFTGSTPG